MTKAINSKSLVELSNKRLDDLSYKEYEKRSFKGGFIDGFFQGINFETTKQGIVHIKDKNKWLFSDREKAKAFL